MNLRNWMNRKILGLIQPDVLSHRALLDRVCSLDGKARQNWQLNRLQDLLDHWLNVPAYRDLCPPGFSANALTSTTDLHPLPIMSKPLLQDRMTQWRNQAPAFIMNSTSGSSGKNFTFLQDPKMRHANSAAVHWAYSLTGANYWGDRRMVIWGHSPGLGLKTRITEDLKTWCLNAKTLQAYGLDDHRCDKYLETIAKWRPLVVEGYPTYLALLARRALATGFVIPQKPLAIISSGEQLTEDQRSDIENFFEVGISNRYGSREFGVIAQAEPGCDIGLVPPTRFILETSPCGELLITDLQNRATPFIRYACGDLGSVQQNPEPGVAQFIRNLAGRIHDQLTTPTGRLIPGQYWTLLSRSVAGIDEFQVRQNRNGSIEFLITESSTLAAEDSRKIQSQVQKEFPEIPSFNVIRVKTLERTALGKRKFVIRESEPGA